MNSFITKEGIEVKPSQIWREPDKRMHGRCIIVKHLGIVMDEGRVRVKGYNHGMEFSPERWLSVRRMHRHSTGFELVK